MDTENFEFLTRLRRRAIWLIFIIIAGILAYFFCRRIISDYDCLKYQNTLIIFGSILVIVISLVMAVITKADSFFSKLMSILLTFGIVLTIPFILGPIGSQTAWIQTRFCPETEDCNIAQGLLDKGELAAAENYAKQGIEFAPNHEQVLFCEEILTQVLIRQVDEKVGVIENTTNKMDAPSINSILAEIEELTRIGKGGEFLRGAFDQLNKRSERACATLTPTPEPTAIDTPTPTPTLVWDYALELFRINKEGNNFVIDLRVYKDGFPLSSMVEENFKLFKGDQEIGLTNVDEKKADDPICLLAVVDNSGSIYDGLKEIRNSVESLNTLRKPEDLVGLIVFDKTLFVQEPSLAPINNLKINGMGDLTAMWLAVDKGIEVLSNCTNETKTMILLTDGSNTVSFNNWDSTTAATNLHDLALEKNVSICPVGVQSDNLDPLSLKMLSTNCEYSEVENFEDVVYKFNDIFGYVRDFYRMTFSRAGNEGTVTKYIELIINDKVILRQELDLNGNK